VFKNVHPVFSDGSASFCYVTYLYSNRLPSINDAKIIRRTHSMVANTPKRDGCEPVYCDATRAQKRLRCTPLKSERQRRGQPTKREGGGGGTISGEINREKWSGRNQR
jgi:hypothetical protein